METVLARMNIESPLGAMCERAETCVEEVTARMETEIRQEWENVWTQLMMTLDATTISTTNLIETAWEE